MQWSQTTIHYKNHKDNYKQITDQVDLLYSVSLINRWTTRMGESRTRNIFANLLQSISDRIEGQIGNGRIHIQFTKTLNNRVSTILSTNGLPSMGNRALEMIKWCASCQTTSKQTSKHQKRSYNSNRTCSTMNDQNARYHMCWKLRPLLSVCVPAKATLTDRLYNHSLDFRELLHLSLVAYVQDWVYLTYI